MFARHPEVTSQIVQQLEGHRDSPFLAAAASSARAFSGTMGFDPPSWQALCEGVREPEGLEPGIERGGWQHEASSRVERQQREVLFERLLPRDRAWVRSQSGPGGSLALTTCPTSVLTKIPPHLFIVVLLRRLRIPLPLAPHTCGCGLPIDSFGHHRASCTRTGGIGAAGIRTRECCSARVLGGRGTGDHVVVDGLPLFGWSQLVVDTTLVCGRDLLGPSPT